MLIRFISPPASLSPGDYQFSTLTFQLSIEKAPAGLFLPYPFSSSISYHKDRPIFNHSNLFLPILGHLFFISAFKKSLRGFRGGHPRILFRRVYHITKTRFNATIITYILRYFAIQFLPSSFSYAWRRAAFLFSAGLFRISIRKGRGC